MNKEEKIDQVGALFDRFHELHQDFGRLWLEETVFHWDWWIAFVLSIGSWIFWIFYRKKDSTQRLLYAGIFAILISVCLDYTGTALGLWYYTGKLTPSFPAWLPFNFCMLPVSIMFLIQTKPRIAPWKKAVFHGLLTSFVGEPIFSLSGFYVLTGWEYYYSVPIYALIYMFCHWLTNRDTYAKTYQPG
ncbi:CBO0543 family protein [Neobacillus dielmonensis]|uniref:CBO0543 family protein n=1 Tax=Neobacillus dielmonensis TaxID=1347369 RepID=UPI0005A8EC52|nr:CBO0543 family protein [Neobacillus dielmonensis]